MERDQAYEASCMQRRLKQPVGHHGANQRADWLVHGLLTVIGLCEDLNKSLLVRGPDTLVIIPPVVSIVQEALDGFSFKLLLKTCLLFDGFFVEQFLPR